LLVLPTELVSGNGSRLGGIVSSLAIKTCQPAPFLVWLGRSVCFADTLVDRIVSEAIEPVGAIAEPYALWAIRRGGFAEPFRHPALQMVDDLEPFERLKLHILNLGHTVLAQIWCTRCRAEDETVRAILNDADVLEELAAIYVEEVVPGFERRDMGAEARRYVATTIERFRNPFLQHRLSDIAQNHRAKLRNRVGAFLDWVRQHDRTFQAPRLQSLLE
jgi:tagaturonate reductase